MDKTQEIPESDKERIWEAAKAFTPYESGRDDFAHGAEWMYADLASQLEEVKKERDELIVSHEKAIDELTTLQVEELQHGIDMYNEARKEAADYRKAIIEHLKGEPIESSSEQDDYLPLKNVIAKYQSSNPNDKS